MAGDHFAKGGRSSNGHRAPSTHDDVPTDGLWDEPSSSGRFGLLAELAGHVRWLLAERAPWILVLPIIGVAAAACDLALMVCLVQALLHLAHSNTTGTLPGLHRDVSTGTLLWVAAAAGVSSMVLRTAESLLVGRFSARAATHARQQVIDTQLRADWWTVSRQRAGYVQQLVGINTNYASTSPGILGTAISSIINLAMYGVFVIATSPLVALLFATLGALASAGFFAFRARMKRLATVAAASAVEVQLLSTSLHSLSRELRVFGVTDGARRQLKGTNDRARGPLARLRTMQRLLPILFQQVVLLLVIVVVAVAWNTGVDAAKFGTAAILAVRSLSYLQNLNTVIQQYVEARPFLNELRTTVTRTEAAEDRRGDAVLGRVTELELDDVRFEYEPGRPVLHGISFDLHTGERLGIVGPSGGGKTTLVSLVAGLIRPTTGRVLVNGRPLQEYTARSWSDQIALVGQEPLLLRGTIASNIAFFRDVSAAQIRDAARRAAILDTIEALPDGFDTPVGDGLSDLSGGQRQRIALARALLTNPSVLLLDEPTSALDSENADRIRETVERLEDRPIVVVISHREDMLLVCNRVVRMDMGRIQESV